MAEKCQILMTPKNVTNWIIILHLLFSKHILKMYG